MLPNISALALLLFIECCLYFQTSHASSAGAHTSRILSPDEEALTDLIFRPAVTEGTSVGLPSVAFFRTVARLAQLIRSSESHVRVIVQSEPSNLQMDYVRIVLSAMDQPPAFEVTSDVVSALSGGQPREGRSREIGMLGVSQTEEAGLRQAITSRYGPVRFRSYSDDGLHETSSAELQISQKDAVQPNAQFLGNPNKFVVVLGNMPLDATTVTVDTMARVREAVVHVLGGDIRSVGVGLRPVVSGGAMPKSSDTVVFTGGKTAGHVSEAMQMALVAGSMGLPLDSIVLEEQARSTQENALYVAKIFRKKVDEGLLNPGRVEISVVSKADHLKWALPIFHEVGRSQGLGCFEKALPVPAAVDRTALISQMQQYLTRSDTTPAAKRIVQSRLANVLNGVQGID